MYNLGLGLYEFIFRVQPCLIIDGAYNRNEKVKHNNNHQDNVHSNDDQAGDALIVSHKVLGVNITFKTGRKKKKKTFSIKIKSAAFTYQRFFKLL